MIQTSRSILIVEDETIVTLDLEQSLQGLGYRVVGICHSGEDAIAKAAEVLPDLIMMDIHLRGVMTGIEAAVEIRRKRDVPIVFLTAYADESTLQDTKRARPYGYLVKPFEDRDLQVSVEIALHQHMLESQMKERERWLTTMMENVADAVVASDASGRIRLLNGRAQTLTGWTGETAIGRDVREVLRTVAGEQGAESSSAPSRRLVSKTGQLVPVVETILPMSDDQGNPAGHIRVIRDDSESRRAGEERAGLAQKLAQARDESDRLTIELASRTQTLLSSDQEIGRMLKGTLDSLLVPAQTLIDRLKLLGSCAASLDPNAAIWLADATRAAQELEALLSRLETLPGRSSSK